MACLGALDSATNAVELSRDLATVPCQYVENPNDQYQLELLLPEIVAQDGGVQVLPQLLGPALAPFETIPPRSNVDECTFLGQALAAGQQPIACASTGGGPCLAPGGGTGIFATLWGLCPPSAPTDQQASNSLPFFVRAVHAGAPGAVGTALRLDGIGLLCHDPTSSRLASPTLLERQAAGEALQQSPASGQPGSAWWVALDGGAFETSAADIEAVGLGLGPPNGSGGFGLQGDCLPAECPTGGAVEPGGASADCCLPLGGIPACGRNPAGVYAGSATYPAIQVAACCSNNGNVELLSPSGSPSEIVCQ